MKKIAKTSIFLFSFIVLIFLLNQPRPAAKENKVWGTQFSSNFTSKRNNLYIGRDNPQSDLRMQVITPSGSEHKPAWQHPLIIEPHIEYRPSDFLKDVK